MFTIILVGDHVALPVYFHFFKKLSDNSRTPLNSEMMKIMKNIYTRKLRRDVLKTAGLFLHHLIKIKKKTCLGDRMNI
jgi:hypothetical protein